jgi:hypothetical protein
LGDVEAFLFVHKQVVRVLEDLAVMRHGQEVTSVAVVRRGSAYIGDDLEVLIQDRNKAAAVAVGRPIVRQMGHEVVGAAFSDLARISAGEIDLPESASVEVESEKVAFGHSLL